MPAFLLAYQSDQLKHLVTPYRSLADFARVAAVQTSMLCVHSNITGSIGSCLIFCEPVLGNVLKPASGNTQVFYGPQTWETGLSVALSIFTKFLMK